MRARCLLAIALLFLCLHGCRSEPSPGRVIVLGLDGIDPQIVDLLMSEGKMPNFARLRQGGAYGRLVSSKPLLSPILWTTIATGKTPDKHGIAHFVAVNEKTGEQLPVTSQMRQVKALWNILSESNRKVDVVGWWATWPAETVRGTIVSDHTCYHFLFEDAVTAKAGSSGTFYPPEAEEALQPMIRRPEDISFEEASAFVHVTPEEFARPFNFNDGLSHFKWALATADTYRAIGLYLWQHDRPDALLVYIEATDSTAHLFGHLFRATGLAGELAEQQRRFGGTVEAMYQYADRIVGDYIAALDRNSTLIVLSDHGFQLGALPDDPSKTRDMRRVSESYHRMEGILYLYGAHVKAEHRLDRPTLVDVAPTVLAVSGVPAAQDMPGHVLTEGIDLKPEPRTVASYESGPHAATAPVKDADVDPAILERLRSLGYLDAQSPKGDRNLAAIQFQEGHYEEAVKAYQALVQEDAKDGGLRASLAGALGALGRYGEAIEQLNVAIDLDPLNPEAYHNRGVIYERQGDRDAAIGEYRAALRYNPQYQPSRDALARLGASAEIHQPATDAQKLAAALADQAGRAARRGDYEEAMKQLDEAARLAPRYALIYQYRSNVAFLMGDREAAIQALRTALEIEPDNALYRTNLERLEQPAGRAQLPPP